MGRYRSRTTIQREVLEKYINKGYSTNRIQKLLSASGHGVRRKILLNEIRIIKGSKVSDIKKQRSVPKKYRKRGGSSLPSGRIYRVSLILNDVPIHSKPFKRNYVGFRLQCFSINQKYLMDNMRVFREILIKEVEQYIGYSSSEWWFSNSTYIGKEYPVVVGVSNFNFLNGRWIFKVESNGRETYSRSGAI